jgi:hypothetical protein
MGRRSCKASVRPSASTSWSDGPAFYFRVDPRRRGRGAKMIRVAPHCYVAQRALRKLRAGRR